MNNLLRFCMFAKLAVFPACSSCRETHFDLILMLLYLTWGEGGWDGGVVIGKMDLLFSWIFPPISARFVHHQTIILLQFNAHSNKTT